MPTEMQDVAVFSPQGLLFPFLHHHTFSPRGMPDRPSLAHRTTLIIFYDPPGSLVFPHQEGHPCWSKCARRTRSFSGRAFREHRTNMDVLPSFHRARSASKKNGLLLPRIILRPRVARAQKIIRLHPLLCSGSKGSAGVLFHPFHRARQARLTKMKLPTSPSFLACRASPAPITRYASRGFAGCSKIPSSKAAGESKPEAYPLWVR